MHLSRREAVVSAAFAAALGLAGRVEIIRPAYAQKTQHDEGHGQKNDWHKKYGREAEEFWQVLAVNDQRPPKQYEQAF